MSVAHEKCPFCDAEFRGESSPRTVSENAFLLASAHVREAHKDKCFTCGRRNDMVAFGGDEKNADYWRPDGGCSYCGSMSPEEFFKAVEAGAEVGPTDKNYKAYVRGAGHGHAKFYFQHLSDADKTRFIELFNTKKMKIGMPGHFYTTPFFCKVEPQPS